jgi:hypothetical protein
MRPETGPGTKMAESEGFEPSNPVRGCQFSRLVYSTALPALRRPFYWFWRVYSTGFDRLSLCAEKSFANRGRLESRCTHVLLESLWDRHRAVLTLVILEDSNQRSPHR